MYQIFKKFNLFLKNCKESLFPPERDSEKIVKILFDAVKEILEQRKIDYVIDEFDPLYFEFLFFEESKILIDDYQVLYSYSRLPPEKTKWWKYDNADDYVLFLIMPNFDLERVTNWILKCLDKDIKLREKKHRKMGNKNRGE